MVVKRFRSLRATRGRVGRSHAGAPGTPGRGSSFQKSGKTAASFLNYRSQFSLDLPLEGNYTGSLYHPVSQAGLEEGVEGRRHFCGVGYHREGPAALHQGLQQRRVRVRIAAMVIEHHVHGNALGPSRCRGRLRQGVQLGVGILRGRVLTCAAGIRFAVGGNDDGSSRPRGGRGCIRGGIEQVDRLLDPGRQIRTAARRRLRGDRDARGRSPIHVIGAGRVVRAVRHIAHGGVQAAVVRADLLQGGPRAPPTRVLHDARYDGGEYWLKSASMAW